MGSVVVNAVVRTLTRKAAGKVIKTARSSSGKKKRSGPEKGSAKAKKGARRISAGSRAARRIKRWILRVAGAKNNRVGKALNVSRPSRG
jgi:hypothetical protein